MKEYISILILYGNPVLAVDKRKYILRKIGVEINE
jgi:hypothetical protein